jgi:hypothetical protein
MRDNIGNVGISPGHSQFTAKKKNIETQSKHTSSLKISNTLDTSSIPVIPACIQHKNCTTTSIAKEYVHYTLFEIN